jgi:UDP-N-acetylglucosamine 4,6-dehydratase/5-epimerase
MFKNKTLLITGGTGSFGNAVLRRFIKTEINEIRIFSRDEKKQHDMRNIFNNKKLKFYIGDVRNIESVNNAMIGVNYVFHAAALKQVPSCEFFPMEATLTNVIGTENVIKSAIQHDVEKVICLSTDKAAYPINAMGMSKALMEKVAIALSRNIQNNRTVICLTRYGNVMASRGSVIPHFIMQIKNKVDITVTDPNMTRYIMSLEEAIDLVIYAFMHGEQGDLFVQKSPASNIGDLAQGVKELMRAENKIRVIGTRHGEKLFETLCTREEMSRSVSIDKYYRIPADARELNYGNYFQKGDINTSQREDYNSHNTLQLNLEEVKEKLLDLDCIIKEL